MTHEQKFMNWAGKAVSALWMIMVIWSVIEKRDWVTPLLAILAYLGFLGMSKGYSFLMKKWAK